MDSTKIISPLNQCEAEGSFDIVKCSLCTEPCMSHDIGLRLRDCGLRCTRQRVELGRLLFADGDRHFTADMLHHEARQAKIHVSLATIYNTLQHFAKAGLIRRLSTGGQRRGSIRTFLSTTTSTMKTRIGSSMSPRGYLTVGNLPPVPSSMEIDRVDVVIHLKRRGA